MKHKGVSALRHRIRMDDIKHDPWGTAMGWHSAIARVLHALDPNLVPANWEYQRSVADTADLEEIAGDPDSEDEDENLEYPDCDVALFVLGDEVDEATLIYWGNVLARYTAACKRAGRSY